MSKTPVDCLSSRWTRCNCRTSDRFKRWM